MSERQAVDVTKLTRAQLNALYDIHRGTFFIRMNGGATRRMIVRLRNAGLIKKSSPWSLTHEGSRRLVKAMAQVGIAYPDLVA